MLAILLALVAKAPPVMGPTPPSTTTTTIPIVRLAGDSANTTAYRVAILAIAIAVLTVVVATARTARVRRRIFAGSIIGLAFVVDLFLLSFPRLRPLVVSGPMSVAILYFGYLGAALDQFWWPFNYRTDVEVTTEYMAPTEAERTFHALSVLVRNLVEPRSITSSVDWLDNRTPVHGDDPWNACWVRYNNAAAPFDKGQGRGLIVATVHPVPGHPEDKIGNIELHPVLVQQLDVPIPARGVTTGSHNKRRADGHPVRVTLSFDDGSPAYRAGFRIEWSDPGPDATASLVRDDLVLDESERPRLGPGPIIRLLLGLRNLRGPVAERRRL
jgi:hypothetical protein